MQNIIFTLIMTLMLAPPVTVWAKTQGLQKVMYENRRDHVFLKYKLDENQNIIPQGFEHPVELSPEEVSDILGKLKYEKYSSFHWKGAYEVFSGSKRKELFSYISQALEQASPDEWIEFSLTERNHGSLHSGSLLTDGCIFKKDGKLNVVLLNLKFEITRKDKPHAYDPRKRYSLVFMRILQGRGISNPPVIPGSPFLSKPHDNWAVIDTAALLRPEEVMEFKAVESMQDKQKDILERLKFLKDLFDQNLITKEEYRTKKEKILKEL